MRGTKDSGVDWLGEIPADWDVRPCWSSFRRVKQTGFPEEELLSVYRDHGVVPKSSRDDNHNVESEDLTSYQLVRVGDMVMNKMKAWQGSIALSDHRGIVSPAYFVYRPTQEFSRKYFHYLLRSAPYVAHYNRISKGVRVGQWDLDPTYFRTTSLIVPPTDEQRRIADFLDRETAKIDALIAKQEQLITTLDERRGAVISRAVTGGINSDIDLRSAETAWFKMIPSHWEAGPLKRFANVTLGKMVTSDTPDGDAVVMPYLRAASVQPKGRIILDDAKQMSFSLRERSRFALKKNDVVVVEGGSIGRSALVEEDLENWGYQNSINRVRAMRNVTGSYLNWCLQALESSGVYSTMTNVATIAHLTAEKLETVPIAVPPLSEQDEICAYLEKVTQDIDLLIEKCSAASRVLRERRQALISASVTGKLEVGV